MVLEVIDWSDFLACERGLLIAPAGHGKTTAIADCLKLCPEDSCHLVLTHTHAGLASLKKKFKEKNITPSKYQLETIDGFAQRYVIAFLGSSVLPYYQDKEYFSVAVKKCTEILQSTVVQNIIGLSFNGVFVDEYQDCTISQHNMIMAIAQNLPLHILGDPLQGIFDFEKERVIDFERDLPELFFRRFNMLNIPWRWAKTNVALGGEILRIRDLLKGQAKEIKLSHMPECGIFLEQRKDANDSYSLEYRRWLSKTVHKYESNSTLIICPGYYDKNSKGINVLKGDLKDRIKIKNQFDRSNSYLLLDAVDGISYYTVSKNIDNYIEKCSKGSRIDPIKHLYDLLSSLYVSKSFLSKWISKKKVGWDFTEKENNEEKKISDAIQKIFIAFKERPSLAAFIDFLSSIKSMRGYSNHRPDFWAEIIRCAHNAISEGESLHCAMEKHRNRLRHLGRRIEGKCIGTTLLTKGLEFDTVIVMYPEKFEDKKNFYVAISRACKTLVFITNQANIKFND